MVGVKSFSFLGSEAKLEGIRIPILGKFMKILLFLITLPLSAADYICSNDRFLSESIELTFTGRSWFMNSCELEGMGEDLRPIDPKAWECTLRNISRPNTDREVVKVQFGEEFRVTGEGYIRLSLDNSFADYGPQRMTSFLYCR